MTKKKLKNLQQNKKITPIVKYTFKYFWYNFTAEKMSSVIST